jgi:MFS transporter, Spinster family, sphingosine-1-phosphate transporter
MTNQDGRTSRTTMALVLLVLINLFNYIDRQVLSAVESAIEESFFPESEYPYAKPSIDSSGFEAKQREDKTIQSKMGSLNTAFMVSYMLIAPLFGFLADRMPRWTLIGIGVIAWSLATGATGLAGSFAILFLTRCLVGVGEAAYGPVAPTVISDLYPVEKRGKMMAIFYMAIPVGSALGYVLGGQITALSGDWRTAFYVVVPPGLMLGAWCLFMKDPPRGASDAGPVARQASWAEYRAILKTPSYLFTTLGMTAMTFAMGGMAFFMPRFAKQGILDSRTGMNPDAALAEANTYFGAIVVVSGLGATILGGIAGDWLKPRFSGAYFLVSAIAMGLAFPMILCAIWVAFPLAWVFIFLACFCLFFNTGPTNTILANVTHPSIRASAFALNILIIHALGDAISPVIIGAVNDRSSLRVGFMVVSVMCLVASVFWLLGMKHLERDTAAAQVQTPPPETATPASL